MGSFVIGFFENIQEQTKALVFVLVLAEEQAISLRLNMKVLFYYVITTTTLQIEKCNLKLRIPDKTINPVIQMERPSMALPRDTRNRNSDPTDFESVIRWFSQC